MTIQFQVSSGEEAGGFIARWDDPLGGGICTQGDDFKDLEAMVRDAVEGYFADREKPQRIQLHFVEDPQLVMA